MDSQKSIQKFFFNTTASPVPFISPTIINHNINFASNLIFWVEMRWGTVHLVKKGPKPLKLTWGCKTRHFSCGNVHICTKTILTVIRNNPGGWKFGLTCKMFQLFQICKIFHHLVQMSTWNRNAQLRWEKGVTETQGHYWSFAYFTQKFSSRSVGDLILSVK